MTKHALYMTLMLFLTGCASSESQKQSEKDQAQQHAQELGEDSQRPFVALLTDIESIATVELWHPTKQSSIWTPKGDAVFYAGRGARVDLKAGTVEFIMKETSSARVYSAPKPLTPKALETFKKNLAQINQVDQAETIRACPASTSEAQDSLTLNLANEQRLILNYRTAPCKAETTDTLSFQRLFDWTEAQGAPWKS